MMKRMVCGLVLGVVFAVQSGCSEADATVTYLSPRGLVADKEGKTIYVAEETAGRVAVLDIASGAVTKTIKTKGQPCALSLSPDGSKLYVANGLPDGQILVVDLKRGKVVEEISVGHSPSAVAVSPDASRLYVANRFNNDVSVVDLATRKTILRVPVLREPTAMALAADGKTLFVANLLPFGGASEDYVAATVSVIDTVAGRVSTNIRLPNGSSGVRGCCLSPDGKNVYVTHNLSRYQLPTTQLERGWMNTSALSVIATGSNTLVNTVLLDDVDLGGANPWGISCTADGKTICVAHAGTHEISVIDRVGLHAKLAKVARGEKVSDVSLSAADVPNDLSFLVDLRRRIKLAGNGPRDLVVVSNTVYVGEYFSDSVGVVDVTTNVRPEAKSLALGAKQALSVTRKGEMNWNDAELCFQHWQSCASCHPDGRTDGFNWDLLNDGIGNPKQTKNMVFAHVTPPAMLSGIRESAYAAVRSGLKFILFAVRPEEDAVAIDEYLKSLRPVSSPYLVKGKLCKAARKGEKLFNEKAGCAICHSGEYFTDMKFHDIGTGKDMDKDKAYDTPTLRECWRTAPYLVDGRAATIEELLTKFNAGDQHGTTSGLSKEEVSQLAEYVLSL